MKIINKLAHEAHAKIFGDRCEGREGLRYFDERHFPGLRKESFEFTNTNGYAIRGGYYSYPNYIKDTIIVFCHGMGGGHQAYMQEINYLAKAGFKVLSVDYQGTILSDGDSLGGASQALQDMDKCIDVINKKFKNIYVIGHSWGGWVAQGLCQFHPEIKKLCTLAGLVSLQGLVDQYFKWYEGFLKKPILKIEQDAYPKYANSNAVDTLNNRKDLKALIVFADDDRILNPKYNVEVLQQKVKSDNVSYIIETGKNHGPHYTHEATQLLGEYYSKLDKLKYVSEIKALEESTDWDKLSEMDENVMNQVVDFFKK